ncbi:MAG: polysaccharide deacetylase family protein [Planctomycetaceae bacterium]
MNKLARKLLKAPRGVPGYLPLARKLHARSAAIVMYHGVAASELPVFNWCQLAAAEFEQQIAFLSREYNVLPLAELIRRMAGGQPLPLRATAITFDDGFSNVKDVAAPLLAKYQLPYTIFLVTSLVGTAQLAWPEQLYSAIARSAHREFSVGGMRFFLKTPEERSTTYRVLTHHMKALPFDEMDDMLQQTLTTLDAPDETPLLSVLGWDDVTNMSRSPLVDFGSHTHTHPILSRCSVERQGDELRTSRDILRERLGNAELFAYPNGRTEDFTRDTKKLLAESGYKCGLTTVAGTIKHSDDLYALRRVCVGADTTFDQFQCEMLGW